MTDIDILKHTETISGNRPSDGRTGSGKRYYLSAKNTDAAKKKKKAANKFQQKWLNDYLLNIGILKIENGYNYLLSKHVEKFCKEHSENALSCPLGAALSQARTARIPLFLRSEKNQNTSQKMRSEHARQISVYCRNA